MHPLLYVEEHFFFLNTEMLRIPFRKQNGKNALRSSTNGRKHTISFSGVCEEIKFHLCNFPVFCFYLSLYTFFGNMRRPLEIGLRLAHNGKRKIGSSVF